MKVKRSKKIDFTSISIPSTLFKKVEKHIEGTGFPSVSGYVAFILGTYSARAATPRPITRPRW